jgi:hypothetical protein
MPSDSPLSVRRFPRSMFAELAKKAAAKKAKAAAEAAAAAAK